jgi:hypothetical protein
MTWWFRLRCKVRRLFGLHVPIAAWHTYEEGGEIKRRPIYIDQFYK